MHLWLLRFGFRKFAGGGAEKCANFAANVRDIGQKTSARLQRLLIAHRRACSPCT